MARRAWAIVTPFHETAFFLWGAQGFNQKPHFTAGKTQGLQLETGFYRGKAQGSN